MMRNNNMECLRRLELAMKENLTCKGTETIQSKNDCFVSSERSVDIETIAIIDAFVLVISTFGLIGNGTVIWFLGFRMKRNPFTTFVLNLAFADLGVLTGLVFLVTLPTLVIFSIGFCQKCCQILFVGVIFLFYMYVTGHFLLTAISIDRCVSVLFPIWHRCHRPQHLSRIVCALTWTLTSVLVGIAVAKIVNSSPFHQGVLYPLFLPSLLCLPLTIVSSLILLIKVSLRPLRKQRRVFRAILLALFFLIFFAFALTGLMPNYVFTISSFQMHLAYLYTCLNSSVNPLIYFLVGRKKQSRSRESMKVVLQRLFKEEEYGREEGKCQVTTQL